MKRTLLLGLLLMCVVTVSACGKDNANGFTSQTDTQSSEDVVDTDSNANVNEVESELDGDNENRNSTVKGELSIDSLSEYEVSSVSDFEVTSLHLEEGEVAIDDYLGKEDVVVIPEEIDGLKVVEIRDYAFKGTDIKAVVIPDSVKVLCRGAFLQCEKLEYVVCGSGLKRLEQGPFFMCSSLKQVKLNEGLEYIGEISFGSCDNLKEIYIPASVTEIDATAFNSGVTYSGKAGSTAEEYANYWDYEFITVE